MFCSFKEHGFCLTKFPYNLQNRKFSKLNHTWAARIVTILYYNFCILKSRYYIIKVDIKVTEFLKQFLAIGFYNYALMFTIILTLFLSQAQPIVPITSKNFFFEVCNNRNIARFWKSLQCKCSNFQLSQYINALWKGLARTLSQQKLLTDTLPCVTVAIKEIAHYGINLIIKASPVPGYLAKELLALEQVHFTCSISIAQCTTECSFD